MDELEFEISATDTGQQRSVRAPRGPRLRRPPRAVTVGLIAACVVLVTTGLALAPVPNLSSKVSVLLHGTPVPPTATPRMVAGGNLLYVEGGLASPWGKLTLNGKPVALEELTTSANNGYASALFLQRGTNTIDSHADPFPELRCRLSVPSSNDDTCPLDASYPFPSDLPKGGPRALDLKPTLDKLPSTSRANLIQAVSAYLSLSSGQATVQPGERYVNGARQIVYADQQLTATFTQALATAASPTSNGCATLCMPVPDAQTASGNVSAVADFVLDAHLTQSFMYATSAGQLVVSDAPISPGPALPNADLVALTVTWNGAWQIAPNGVSQPSSAACVAGATALTPYLFDPRFSQYNQQSSYIGGEITSANPADGCVFRLDTWGAYGGAYTQTASNYVHVFYRFGVVMVVNTPSDVTRASYDYALQSLPLADDAETALAQQIDATQPYS